MKQRRFLSFVCVLVTVMAVFIPSPASAGGGTFDCTGEQWLWQGFGNGYCHGQATGVYGSGPSQMVCLPVCTIHMEISTIANVCATREPSMLGTMTGQVTFYGTGMFQADFSATITGTSIEFVFTNPNGAGAGELIPFPPIPSCGDGGFLDFRMEGTTAFLDQPV